MKGGGEGAGIDWSFWTAVAVTALVAGMCWPSVAHAQVAAANGVKDQMTALALPAVSIGFAWLGYLTLSGKTDMQTFMVFLIGAAIVLGAGYLI